MPCSLEFKSSTACFQMTWCLCRSKFGIFVISNNSPTQYFGLANPNQIVVQVAGTHIECRDLTSN